MKKKKVILVIIDGLGDEYIPELGGTPLEHISSELITLNKMANEGMCGLVNVIRPGIPPSSDTAHFTIFGYDLSKEYTGRGYFEALGANIPIQEGEVSLRFNLATVERVNDLLYIRDRRAGRISGRDAEELIKTLQKAIDDQGIPAEVHHILEHRGVLVIKSESKLSRCVSDVDPHETNVPVLKSTPFEETPSDELESAKITAQIINEITKLSYEVLNDHPINKEREEKGLPKANIILSRGAGIAIKLAPFKEKWGMDAAYVAGGPLYKGVAKAVGMKEIYVEGATGTVNTNLEGKVSGVLRAINSGYDFVFLHIKGTDSLSHDKKSREKAEFILKIDKVISKLLEVNDVVITVTGDHSTSSRIGRHIGLPVPIVFYSDGVTRRNKINRFNEVQCAEKGALGVIKGSDIMPILLDLSNRTMEYGLRPSPKKVIYSGAFGEPLHL